MYTIASVISLVELVFLYPPVNPTKHKYITFGNLSPVQFDIRYTVFFKIRCAILVEAVLLTAHVNKTFGNGSATAYFAKI